jgi:hypothetical protein
MKVVGEYPGAVLVPPVSVKLDLEAAAKPPAPPAKPASPPAPARPWVKTADGRLKHVPQTGREPVSRLPPGARTSLRQVGEQPKESWWTARATSGEVTSGFTKDEILRKPETDPRAEGGMFERLEGLLAALKG